MEAVLQVMHSGISEKKVAEVCVRVCAHARTHASSVKRNPCLRQRERPNAHLDERCHPVHRPGHQGQGRAGQGGTGGECVLSAHEELRGKVGVPSTTGHVANLGRARPGGQCCVCREGSVPRHETPLVWATTSSARSIRWWARPGTAAPHRWGAGGVNNSCDSRGDLVRATWCRPFCRGGSRQPRLWEGSLPCNFLSIKGTPSNLRH